METHGKSNAAEDTSSRERRPRAIPVSGPFVSNVVCGMNLNCRFDLKHIALHGRNVVYNPKRFPAAILRIREPKSTALVFEGGKMQVLGTRSIDDAKLASRKFARILQKMGYQPRMEGFTVQNMVGNCDTKLVIRLEGLQYDLPKWTKYEPELFPGLVFKVETRAVALKVLVFAKGKLVFLGARQKLDMDLALDFLYPLLVQYKRT